MKEFNEKEAFEKLKSYFDSWDIVVEPKKQFINPCVYPFIRSKYNPLRYIFGKYSITRSIDKYIGSVDFDTKDIKIVKNEK